MEYKTSIAVIPTSFSYNLQGVEDHSNSTTTSATSPVPETHAEDESALWRALSHNGHTPGAPLSGEASQLLRKLITCRKLGMSITPAPSGKPPPPGYAEARREVECPNAKTAGRRKQSFPTKATVEDTGGRDVASPTNDMETEADYLPDFTGNNPWCNLQIVKTKVTSRFSERVYLRVRS